MSLGRIYKFLRFGLTGTAASLLYAVLVYTFIKTGWLNPTFASFAAYTLAIPFSFLGQKYFTFKTHGEIKSEFPRFILLQGLGLFIATGIMAGVERSPYNPMWGILAVVIAVPLLSFILMNSFVFKKSSVHV